MNGSLGIGPESEIHVNVLKQKQKQNQNKTKQKIPSTIEAALNNLVNQMINAVVISQPLLPSLVPVQWAREQSSHRHSDGGLWIQQNDLSI